MSEIVAFPSTPQEGAVRQLPRNIEAEAAFLGAVLIDNRVVEDLPVQLQADHFFEPLHGRIFAQAMALIERNSIATPVTLKPYFEHDEQMKAVGGVGYLAQLTGSGAGLIGARDIAQQLFDLALLRELVGVGRNLVENALDTSESVNPQAQIEEAETSLYRVAGGDAAVGSVKSFAQASLTALQTAEKALNSGGGVSGITTGISSVNAKIGGLHDSDLMILAGRPGMGKTSFATNIAYNAASRWLRDHEDGVPPEKNIGAKVAFFSLEMSADQLATRILAEQSGVSGEALRMGKISKEQFQQLARAVQELQKLPLYIDDTAGLTIASLRTRARRLQRRHDIGFIVVDYLQLLQGSSKSGDNRVQEISEISRGLKTLAKELNVPVMALSQLSRQVESREDKRPQLSDLRESGSIEQDADMVLFVFREDYYVAAKEPKRPMEGDDIKIHAAHEEWASEMERVFGLAEVIVAKSRHGSTGKIRLQFDAKTTKFHDLADDSMAYDDYE
jgi:replicative DNA helicase